MDDDEDDDAPPPPAPSLMGRLMSFKKGGSSAIPRTGTMSRSGTMARGGKKKAAEGGKKKKAAPMVEETDNPLFPMGESRETGTGRLDGLGAKEELNEGLSQLQDFVATTMTTEEEETKRAHRPAPLRPAAA